MTSRRAFLRTAAGLGAATLLAPALAKVARAGADAPRRVVFFFAPNGMPPALWTPPDTGAGWTPSPILSAIEPIRDRTLVLTGLQNEVNGYTHGSSAVLRGWPRDDTSSPPSVDQAIARAVGDRTSLRSLQLSSERGLPCRSGTCASFSHVSFVAGGVASELDTSTTAVYRRLFGASSTSVSVLDAVRDDLAGFVARGSSDDARRLDAFAEGLRTVERRLGEATCPSTPPSTDPLRLYGDDDHVRSMLDLLVLALQCDRTRVATYMLGSASSNRPLDFLGIGMSHHLLSHTGDRDGLVTMAHWELGHLVYLVERLADTPDVDGGTLLDHTWVFFVSEFGDGTGHDPHDQPVLLCGGPSGPPRGQHLAYPGRPLADLWLGLERGFGLTDPTFGRDGTEPLIDLT